MTEKQRSEMLDKLDGIVSDLLALASELHKVAATLDEVTENEDHAE